MNKKEKVICEFKTDLKTLCWRSNMIQFLGGQVRKFFWSEIGSGFRESGGTPPSRIPKSNPPPGPALLRANQVSRKMQGEFPQTAESRAYFAERTNAS